MDRIKRALNSIGGRFATGLVLCLSIVVGLWPDHPRPLDLDKFAFIVASAITWLFAELSGFSSPSGHDVQLFKSIFEHAGDSEREFIRTTDFLNSFDHAYGEGIWTMAMWKSVAYQFNDKKMQARWSPVKTRINDFSRIIVQNTGPVGASVTFMSVHPDHGDRDNPDEWVEKNANELNVTADLLYKELEDFQLYGRRRLAL